MPAYVSPCCDGEHSIRGDDRRHRLDFDILWQDKALTETFDSLLVAFLLLDATLDDHFPILHCLDGHFTSVQEVLHVHYDLK